MAPVYAVVLPAEIAVVINQNDPYSVEVGRYYQQQRNIPAENIIFVKLPVNRALGVKAFNAMREKLYRETPETVQFYALAWTEPYRVGCMSMTSAVTFGFDRAYCVKGCKPTKRSIYYNSDTDMPFTELGIRPSMMLAASSIKQAKAMIDRGIKSDGSRPAGTAYLVSTTDRARNVRSRRYPVILDQLSDRLHIERVETNALTDRGDVLFYFTGRVRVEKLDTNTFLPGAMADHLTSTGGNLLGTKQMSILKWIDAGATGSFGTVVEPCAFTQKFPNPGIVIDRYTKGESLIEAYWKSVAWPGQGLFIGEPLAAPYAVSSRTAPQ